MSQTCYHGDGILVDIQSVCESMHSGYIVSMVINTLTSSQELCTLVSVPMFHLSARRGVKPWMVAYIISMVMVGFIATVRILLQPQLVAPRGVSRAHIMIVTVVE